MTISSLPEFIREYYEVHEWKHATAILEKDFPDEWQNIIEVLTSFRLRKSYIAVPGGNKSLVADVLDKDLLARGWIEKDFQTKVVVDKNEMNSPTHKVDCYKNRIALEIEWNNKCLMSFFEE